MRAPRTILSIAGADSNEIRDFHAVPIKSAHPDRQGRYSADGAITGHATDAMAEYYASGAQRKKNRP